MLKHDIQSAITTALKGKQETELKVLRFILSQIKYEEINKQKELTDDEIVSLIQKEVKKRKEAMTLFEKGNRHDLIADEQKQIDILGVYLPKQLAEAEIDVLIDATIKENPDTPHVGKIIGMVMQKTKGRADGSTIAAKVNKRLQDRKS